LVRSVVQGPRSSAAPHRDQGRGTKDGPGTKA